MKLAKLRHRVMAALLDLVIVVGLLFVFTLFKLPSFIAVFRNNEHLVSTKVLIDLFRWGVLFGVIFIVYYAITPILFNGQTIGKKVFKLQIQKENGETVGYKTMFYREAIGRIFINFSSLGMAAIASLIIMGLREDRKGLADILAKTKVVDLYEESEE